MPTRTILALTAALLLAFATPEALMAKQSGSGSSFSSGGSRSSSSSGWSSSSRPYTPPPPSSSGSSSGWSSSSKPAQSQSSGSPAAAPGGWSNSSGAASSQSARPSGTSAFSASGADAVKRQAAASSYKDYQGLYTKSGNPVNSGQAATSQPLLNQSRTFGSYQEYNNYRDNYYYGRGWYAPGWSYQSYPSFGVWDAMFMWFMLSNLTSGPSFFYNHQNDPGVQSFQQEAAKLAQSNADLKKQLDEVNAKLDDMKKNGVPADPNALPKDVDPSLALAKPKIQETGLQEPANASSSLFWPIVTLVGLGGAGYFIFLRKRA